MGPYVHVYDGVLRVAVLLVYINGQDFSIAFNTEGNTFQRTVGELVVRRTNDTLRASYQEGQSWGNSCFVGQLSSLGCY